MALLSKLKYFGAPSLARARLVDQFIKRSSHGRNSVVESSMYSVNRFTCRQHNCSDLKNNDVGKRVTLYGWVKHIRTHGSAIFLIINDAYGDVQLLLKNNEDIIRDTTIGSVIKAEGIVAKRPAAQVNEKMKTGTIEVKVEQFELINRKTTQTNIIKESDRLKYRYIDLRTKDLSSNLRLKSLLMNNIRNFFHQEGFVEIETPILQKHTPGGAHEFIVPTRDPDQYYCLAQSPQIFKQLLMVSGIDRYFQIARCFRDEVSRPDRQPEFSQVDLEMSFTTTDGIIDLIETLLVAIWPSFAGSVSIPFPRISYQEALAKYGSDKPDLRSDIELHDLTNPLKELTKSTALALAVPGGCEEILKNKLYEASLSVAQDLSFEHRVIGLRVGDLDDEWTTDREGASFRIDEATKFFVSRQMKLNKGDYLFIAYGGSNQVRRYMGKLRNSCVRCISANGIANVHDNAFVWITEFPLFVQSDDQIESSHHPFSAPKVDQVDKLYSNPLEVIGDQFDLVLNGEEVGGGSMRIHDANIQEYILKEILKVDYSSLQFFLDALRSGAPPHGGIALGLDRLIRIICNASSIRDVIAFPKSFTGKDPLSGGPTSLPRKILQMYNIRPS